jgi:hypothetical protein
MIELEQIPEEVLRALCASMGCEWAMQDKEDQIIIRRHITAAINAWPNIDKIYRSEDEKLFTIILPLTQENNNDQG